MPDFNQESITLSNEQKIEILLKALEERYKSIHIIRQRVQNICIWTLGLFITAAGWLMQSPKELGVKERILFSLIILITIIVVRAFYLNDLEKGFKTQQQIQARIENVLGLCKSGVFSKDPIYPESWQKAGTSAGKGKFFVHNYLLIYLGTLLLLVSIWIV
jgi:hypothetical protein